MPFVIPVKAMALTVSTLMCGTMFTTYYFCVHDSECPALPKLGHPLTESSANRRVEIIFADVQGKEENLRESARYRPACFVSDGSHRREM